MKQNPAMITVLISIIMSANHGFDNAYISFAEFTLVFGEIYAC